MRRFLAAFVALALAGTTPAGAQDSATMAVPLSANTYLDLFDDAAFRGVAVPSDAAFEFFVEITGDVTLDARIRALAEARGYRRQPFASVRLVAVDGRTLQAPVAEAWSGLRAMAAEDGISLVLTSAHRDLDEQKSLFVGRLAGTSDAAIDAALESAAPPGYSRHHTGYAIDVGEAGSGRGGFIGTEAYAWLSALDFAQAKTFGFVPSYPEGGEHMGPDPEPWELVWVGPGRIACTAGMAHPIGFCDVTDADEAETIAWLIDRGVTVGCRPGRFCSDDPITRGEAASMIWRLAGGPAPRVVAPFADVFPSDHFADAVTWLWNEGVVSGTSPSTFSPDALLAPGDALVIAVRLEALLGSATSPAEAGPTDLPGPLDDVGLQMSRGEFAHLIRVLAG